MNGPVKVLYFVDRMLRGGIQSLVIDWVSKFDKKKITVDFLLLDDGNTYELEETLKEYGCKVYKLNGIWINKPSDYIKEAHALDVFFKEHHDYQVLHLHSSSKNFLVLKYAKKYGIKMRISHSHNIDFQTNNKLKKIVGNVFKYPLVKYSTHYFACSKIAGEFLFGKKVLSSEKFYIIHNAVDYEKFKYDESIRKTIRDSFNINEEDIVIGHIGRYVYQKNHDFLIDVFNELAKENKRYKLLLVGTGELEESIKQKVSELKLCENVIFVGFSNEVNKIIQGMDLFAFPSRFEGLGLVLVEAQASGIPCFATELTIPEEVKINDNFKFLELDKNKWVSEIKKCEIKRVESKNNLKNTGYLIEDIISKLTNIYLSGKDE